MLVLSRKANEQIQIGDGITITILRVRGDQIRIGIDAPREIQVRRSELPPLPQSAPMPRPQRPRPRRAGEQNPGERSFAFGSQPLVSKLPARRVPSARTTSLMN